MSFCFPVHETGHNASTFTNTEFTPLQLSKAAGANFGTINTISSNYNSFEVYPSNQTNLKNNLGN